MKFLKNSKIHTAILSKLCNQLDIRKFAMQPSPESYRFAFDPSLCGLNACKEFANGTSKNPYQAVSQNIKYADLFSKYSKMGWLTPDKKRELVRECSEVLGNNTPILYGFFHDHSFMHHCNGFIPMPNIATFSPIGGHAVTIVGYGNYNKTYPSRQYFKFINSWGHLWGHRGFGYLPEEYLTNPNVFSLGGYAVDLPKAVVVAPVKIHETVPEIAHTDLAEASLPQVTEEQKLAG